MERHKALRGMENYKGIHISPVDERDMYFFDSFVSAVAFFWPPCLKGAVAALWAVTGGYPLCNSFFYDHINVRAYPGKIFTDLIIWNAQYRQVSLF